MFEIDDNVRYRVSVSDDNGETWRGAIPAGSRETKSFATFEEAESELNHFWINGGGGLRRDIGLEFAVEKLVTHSSIIVQTVGAFTNSPSFITNPVVE